MILIFMLLYKIIYQVVFEFLRFRKVCIIILMVASIISFKINTLGRLFFTQYVPLNKVTTKSLRVLPSHVPRFSP